MATYSFEDKQNHILCYTREPLEELVYSAKLAYSMHLAYSPNGVDYTPLNHNSGVLFAKATDNDDRTLNAKSLKNPYMFQLADERFGVVAVRTEADGSDDQESKGAILFFVTDDLLQYEEIGLITIGSDVFVADVSCHYDADEQTYIIRWADEEGNWYKNRMTDLFALDRATAPEPSEPMRLEPVQVDHIEGIVPRNAIVIPPHIARRLVLKLTVPTNIGMETAGKVTASSAADLNAVKALAKYSDGTRTYKNVKWHTEEVDWHKPGTYEIKGTVYQEHYDFPVAVNRADPCIGRWNDKYYFIATNDADGNRSLNIREAETIAGLANAEEVLILDTETYDHVKGLLWAPEFHVIEDDLYIFHAATTGEFFYEEAHVMKLRRGGNPLNKADWSAPELVVKKDGTPLCEAGKVISLDMTVIKQNGAYYASWSERQFLPVDTGAWIYIAKLDAKEPWKLASDPVLLSKPDYGWANNRTFVDEGPFALYHGDKLYMTISSAAVDASYVVGLLSADKDADLLDPNSWTKGNYPLLTSRSVPGEYGPGHNSYITDDDGIVWNVYHARDGLEGPRCTGIRRVHFDIDGDPVLDLTSDKDLNPELTEVSLQVVVK